jgi:hypothetical protein
MSQFANGDKSRSHPFHHLHKSATLHPMASVGTPRAPTRVAQRTFQWKPRMPTFEKVGGILTSLPLHTVTRRAALCGSQRRLVPRRHSVPRRSYIPPMLVFEQSLNSGRTVSASKPERMRSIQTMQSPDHAPTYVCLPSLVTFAHGVPCVSATT